MHRLLSLAALLALTALAFAQDKGEKGTLTNDNLKATLDDMGLKPTEVRKGLCTVTLDRDDYKATYRIYPSSDGRLVFLAVRRFDIHRPAEMPAKFWRGLLAANETMTTTQTAWSYSKTDRVLELVRFISNVGLTPAALRKELNDLHAVVKKNNPVWREKEPAFAPIKDTADDTKERARLKGKWVAYEVVNAGTVLDEKKLKEETKNVGVSVTFDEKGAGTIQLGIEGKFVSRLGPSGGLMSIYVGDDKVLNPTRYKLEKDELTLCMDPAGMTFPPAIESNATNRFAILKLKRGKE